MFPYLYGGTSGDTSYSAVAFDDVGNIAAGGYSLDLTIISGSTQLPIVVFYS
jgi:hypothetical protein